MSGGGGGDEPIGAVIDGAHAAKGRLHSSDEAYTLVDTALAQALTKVRVRRVAESVTPWLAFRRVLAEDVLAPRNVPE